MERSRLKSFGRIAGGCWDNRPLVGQDPDGSTFVWIKVAGQFSKHYMNKRNLRDRLQDFWEIRILESLDLSVLATLRRWGLLAPLPIEKNEAHTTC